MPDNLEKILKEYINNIRLIYGESLNAVILYGSYARGDFRPDSDIDIMILVDLEDEEIKEKAEQISLLTFNINLDYDLMIMPIVKNLHEFYYWVDVYPFYSNVQSEGIRLYAA